MASNFVDDIEDYCQAKTASYVNVFNLGLNQDDPGYFEIGRIL